MLCGYCKSQANFTCQCLCKICRDHIEAHRKTCKKFKLNVIEDNLNLFSKDLTERINKIDKIICEIMRKTGKTTLKIENLCKKSVNRLKAIKNNYLKILDRGEYIESELNKEIFIKEVYSPNLSSIEKYYKEEFYSEKAKNTIDKVKSGNIKQNIKKPENKRENLLEGHTGAVRAVAITHDNKYIISGSWTVASEYGTSKKTPRSNIARTC